MNVSLYTSPSLNTWFNFCEKGILQQPAVGQHMIVRDVLSCGLIGKVSRFPNFVDIYTLNGALPKKYFGLFFHFAYLVHVPKNTVTHTKDLSQALVISIAKKYGLHTRMKGLLQKALCIMHWLLHISRYHCMEEFLRERLRDRGLST